MEERGRQILGRVLAKGSLPSLSPLAVKLVELASDDRSSASDLARIIEQDPGLTTRLLRLVNSTAYRRSHDDITSVTRAVVLVGLREVRIMALSLSLRDTLPVKKAGPDYHLFWRSSLHRAVLSREVARRLALAESEEAFVAGLLLEMGLPLLLRSLKEEEAGGFPGFGASLKRQINWERLSLGLDHREVGETVLRQWGLPEVLAFCQRLPSEAGRDNLPMLAEVTDFARRATEAFFLPEVNLTDIHQLAWRYFGFDDETVNQVLAASLVYVGEAAHALDIKLDQQSDLLEVMEKANEALSRLSSQLGPHLRAMADGQPPPEQPSAAGESEQRRLQDQAVVNTLEAVVHEIRNPLMSVGGFARRLAKQLEGGGQVEKYAQVILSEAARLDQVLGEMNALLSPYQPKMRSIELVTTIREVAEAMGQEQSAEANCPPRPEIKWHLPPGELGLTGDPQGLSEACRQLIAYASHLLRQSNACGPLQVHLQVRDQEAVLTFFGPGRPPEPDRDAMAEKSFGPELSLAKARRIVEAHQGRLFTAPNPKGDGFVITAHLPRLRRAA